MHESKPKDSDAETFYADSDGMRELMRFLNLNCSKVLVEPDIDEVRRDMSSFKTLEDAIKFLLRQDKSNGGSGSS